MGSDRPVELAGPDSAVIISAEQRSRLARLTPRQKDCLRLSKPGYPSKAIARDLDISPLRVDAHIGDAKVTLGVGSRFEAARLLRLWEQQEAGAALGAQMGVQSTPLPPTSDLVSDPNADDTEVPGARTVNPGDARGPRSRLAQNEPETGPTPPYRFVGSAPYVRVAPSFFAVAISIIAIAIAVGAVTALLIAFDWNGHS